MVLDTCTSLFSLRSSDPFPPFFLSPFHAISVQISVALFRFFRYTCHRVSYDESFINILLVIKLSVSTLYIVYDCSQTFFCVHLATLVSRFISLNLARGVSQSAICLAARLRRPGTKPSTMAGILVAKAIARERPSGCQ